MSDAVDVAIVGAGPYGLSAAAHLRAAGVSFRQFGLPMRLWRESMPRGMFLKSQGFASNLSDPEGRYTLEAFCAKTGHPYARYGLPVPLDNFISYGQWFADELVPGLEEIMVTDVAARDGGFDVTLADGQEVRARNVIVAAGVEHFARLPRLLADLPSSLATHASQHTDLAELSGQRVAVIGAGQSALESAALLNEGGADVEVIVRAGELAWNGQPLDPERPLPQRMREPEAGLGSGYSTWFYSRHPELYWHLPERIRVGKARTALGPAGAWWLRRRVEDQFPVSMSTVVRSATERGSGVELDLIARDGTQRQVRADHVVAGTGYRPNIGRLSFLDGDLQARLKTVDGTIAVGRDYQSSQPGLYVIGPAVAPSFGPVMRFVYGSDHAATTVGRGIAASSRRSSRVAVPSGR
ncbi:MAG TPA: NAD(P)-binding domain-containing protein [Streptosporangiaceae bacterium]|jgi:cation diffusion facilitator CzcD-associated flavoprotein CzcO